MTTSYAQDIGAAIQDATAPPASGTPLQRGLGETIRGGIQGGSLGDSLRRGVGEAAQSALESPAQTLQRDQQLRAQQQLGVQQPAPFGTQNSGTLYRDEQGRSYTLDAQGGRVYLQQQNAFPVQGPQPPQAFAQGNSSPQWQANNRPGPTLGVAIEPAEQGVRVLNVRPGSAAEQAGLQRGDIITGVNGRHVVSAEALVQSVHASAGAQLDLMVVRNGQPSQMTAMISEPDPDATQRVAKPAIDGEASSGLSQQFQQLQTQMAELQNELQTLRQEVMALKTSNAEPGNPTETLNNTAPTPLDESPADLFQETTPPVNEDAEDLFEDNADVDAAPSAELK